MAYNYENELQLYTTRWMSPRKRMLTKDQDLKEGIYNDSIFHQADLNDKDESTAGKRKARKLLLEKLRLIVTFQERERVSMGFLIQ